MPLINYSLPNDYNPIPTLPDHLLPNGSTRCAECPIVSISFPVLDKDGTYEGELENGRPHGQGRFKAAGDSRDHFTIIEGDWKNGLPHGHVEFKIAQSADDPYKTAYIGFCKNGLLDGGGQLNDLGDSGKAFIYKGDWKRGWAHGAGSYQGYTDNIEGNFADNQVHGFARYENHGKLLYEGDFVRNEFQGQGKLYDYSYGLIYSGCFNRGLPTNPEKKIDVLKQSKIDHRVKLATGFAKYAGVSLAAIFLLSKCSESDAAEFDQVAKPEQQRIETVAPKPQNTDNQRVLSAF